MALPALATVEDLAAWLDESIDPTDPRALAVLRMASARVRSYTGRTWVDDSGDLTDVPDEVWSVTVQVAARAYTNPSGIVQETTGPFTARWPEEHGQVLFLTAAEQAALDPYRSRPTLWTMRTEHDDPMLRTLAASTVWVDVEGSSEPFPAYDDADLPEGE